MPSAGTSQVEITHISVHGIWLFMSYEDFPWFKDQPVKIIHNVEEQSPGHFYWPDIDVDLSENIIENPSHYPLKQCHFISQLASHQLILSAKLIGYAPK